MSLREGYTTGSSATAAAMAAFALLLGVRLPDSIDCPLPPFKDNETRHNKRHLIPLHSLEMRDNCARAVVIKDGGDDPDATHRAPIIAEVALLDADSMQPREGEIFLPAPLPVILAGGEGVGRATLPGLPVAVGEPAINPVPRRQIQEGLREIAMQYGYTGGLKVTISVQDGAKIATKTLNPRLGIVDGISILGTQGTVRPYSNEAWMASILEGLSVARAVGCPRVFLTTGRRSERLLQEQFPDRAQAYIQVADFAEYSLRSAVETGFTEIIWGCFFGKLVKLAQGLGHTHAHSAPLEMDKLAAWCAEAGDDFPPELMAQISACTTANQALSYIQPRSDAEKILHFIALKAKATAESFAPDARITMMLFSMDPAEHKELVRL